MAQKNLLINLEPFRKLVSLTEPQSDEKRHY